MKEPNEDDWSLLKRGLFAAALLGGVLVPIVRFANTGDLLTSILFIPLGSAGSVLVWYSVWLISPSRGKRQ